MGTHSISNRFIFIIIKNKLAGFYILYLYFKWAAYNGQFYGIQRKTTNNKLNCSFFLVLKYAHYCDNFFRIRIQINDTDPHYYLKCVNWNEVSLKP